MKYALVTVIALMLVGGCADSGASDGSSPSNDDIKQNKDDALRVGKQIFGSGSVRETRDDAAGE